MARAYVVPIGYIERQTGEGATFILNNAEDSKSLRTNTPVTVWRYSPEHLALAKIRGLISAVGYVTATFRTVESVIDARSGPGQALEQQLPQQLRRRDDALSLRAALRQFNLRLPRHFQQPVRVSHNRGQQRATRFAVGPVDGRLSLDAGALFGESKREFLESFLPLS